MTEAERYLEERLRQKKMAIPPPIPSSPSAPRSPISSVSGGVASQPSSVQEPLGVKWLNFFIYGLVPLNMVCLVYTVGVLVANWSALESFSANPGVSIIASLADFAMLVALFIGLRARKDWAWWLLMGSLVAKAPMGAFSRYSPSRDPTPFFVFLVIGFFLVCLPQLVYFYRRRHLFNVPR